MINKASKLLWSKSSSEEKAMIATYLKRYLCPQCKIIMMQINHYGVSFNYKPSSPNLSSPILILSYLMELTSHADNSPLDSIVNSSKCLHR